ncbi:MAG TPA: M23 family metallopeptidase [Ignavibacteria bacterium]|nr:M23 family metallopeptidase [Ignavibacteria bacterium]
MKNGIFILLITLIFLSCSGKNETYNAAGEKETEELEKEKRQDFYLIYFNFNLAIAQYKLGLIDKEVAAQKIESLLKDTEDFYNARSEKLYSYEDWVFPLQGYGPDQIGGKNGNGFKSNKSDFLEGKYSGHPAHDIFIFDKNQDNLDDRTNQPVNVLSLSGGIVVSTKESWMLGDKSKGGKFIWVYDPVTQSVFYYAHNNEIFVDVGDLVKPGDKIATVGRTGNAFESRSPTHLHLGMFKIIDKLPQPHNYYKELVKAKQVG